MSMLLEVDNISVSFDGFKAINNLSFNIGYHELRAIIGPNGAGKTTFMDIITGKTRPDSGNVIWGEDNISLLRYSTSKIAQFGIARKFQKPTVFEQQSVLENLQLALDNNRSSFATVFYRDNRADQQKIADIAEQIGLSDKADELAGTLSHGQKQWLELGMLIAQNVELLLIDEPAAGMTAPERKTTVKLLKELSKTKSVIVVEHDMEFIRDLDCRVTVLHEGSVLAEGSIDHVSADPNVIEVYLGR